MSKLKDSAGSRSIAPTPQHRVWTKSRLLLLIAVLVASALHLASPFTSLALFSFGLSTPSPDFTTLHIHTDVPHAHILRERPKRVAIIGAGASGSSAAWFLSRAGGVMAGRLGVDRREILDEIVIFDKESRPGGLYPFGNESLRAVELGGSIFVAANRHMNKGVKRFGLETVDPDIGEAGIGIWDGQRFVFQSPASKSKWSDWLMSTLIIRQYGPLSPLRTRKAVATLLKRFANLYNPAWLSDHGPAESVGDFSERVGLGREYVTRRGDEWARKVVGVNERWLSEIWSASTRVNYAADMDEIHALGAAVSMAADGGRSVKGGNWQIFQGMLDESGATQRLGVEVTDVIPLVDEDGRQFQVTTNDSIDNGLFDQVFYATPWFSGVGHSGMPTLQQHLVRPMPHTPYVHLHVTLMTTNRPYPHPSFFSLPDDTVIPSSILTTSGSSSAASESDHTDFADTRPAFQSISWTGETYLGSGTWVVKIFSKSALPDTFLAAILGEPPSWALRKEWDAYPVLQPLSHYPPVEPVLGVQYLAALEPWVSTMETQTLSAREAVARVVEGWWGLGYGECEGGADAWDWSCEE